MPVAAIEGELQGRRLALSDACRRTVRTQDGPPPAIGPAAAGKMRSPLIRPAVSGACRYVGRADRCLIFAQQARTSGFRAATGIAR